MLMLTIVYNFYNNSNKEPKNVIVNSYNQN